MHKFESQREGYSSIPYHPELNLIIRTDSNKEAIRLWFQGNDEVLCHSCLTVEARLGGHSCWTFKNISIIRAWIPDEGFGVGAFLQVVKTEYMAKVVSVVPGMLMDSAEGHVKWWLKSRGHRNTKAKAKKCVHAKGEYC